MYGPVPMMFSFAHSRPFRSNARLLNVPFVPAKVLKYAWFQTTVNCLIGTSTV